MQLSLTVFAVVVGMTVFVALLGYLIDRSAEAHERKEGR
jgi:hypothetical protein